MSGRRPRSEKGPGQQKTVWFSPENLSRIHTQRTKAGLDTSFNEAVNSLVESGAHDAVETSNRRLQEIKELRRLDKEKDKIIARLQRDLEALIGNSKQGEASLQHLEVDLLSVHPKSRNRIAKKLLTKED